uniref:Uncharacterized protein n=1 Tax=Panagrellus redivivus TaxID=6233 RepID=A0A7E4V145_PANRE
MADGGQSLTTPPAAPASPRRRPPSLMTIRKIVVVEGRCFPPTDQKGRRPWGVDVTLTDGLEDCHHYFVIGKAKVKVKQYVCLHRRRRLRSPDGCQVTQLDKAEQSSKKAGLNYEARWSHMWGQTKSIGRDTIHVGVGSPIVFAQWS